MNMQLTKSQIGLDGVPAAETVLSHVDGERGELIIAGDHVAALAAQSSFEGKIFVRPQAQKTEAYQLNHNLLLSEGAVAHAKPNLEIFADDVKASHGATFAQVDKEQLFYLKSRGISTETASQLLIRGYRQEMVNQISHAVIREEFQNGL